jgi:hypothetical protein
MANIPIWPGTSSFVSGSGQTPFGFYDGDISFQQEADKVANWCARRLGYPLMEIELQAINFYTAFEEAITVYSNEVYQYKIRENFFSMQGNSTGSSYNNQVITPNLGSIVRISQTYAVEAGSGGNVTQYTASFKMTPGIQDYDLKEIMSSSYGITSSIEVKKLFYQEPPAIVRYFDPYAGTGTGIQSLLETFGFGQFSPGINFLLMPIYFDVQKIQAIELNDQIRKSAYSFDLVNNKLRIFPIPNTDLKMFFHYILVDERNSVIPLSGSGIGPGKITDVSNVPYTNPTFALINSVGKQWIYQYTLAICKEMLAYIRGKYTQIPIPGAEVTLNQADLLADARTEKEKLLEVLRANLDVTSRKTQLENQALEAESIQKTLTNVPIGIYIF